jgi:hypothetical protein
MSNDTIKWDDEIKWDEPAKSTEPSKVVAGRFPPNFPRREPVAKPDFTEGQTVMVNGKPRQVVMVDGEPRYKEDVAPSMGYKQVTPASKAAMAGLLGVQAQGTPIAGALQMAGIDKPADIMQKNAQYAKGVAGDYGSAAELGSEIFNPYTMQALKLGQKGMQMIPKIKDSVMATSGGLGAIQAALTPTAEGESKAEQIGWGTAGGSLFGKGTQMLASPQVSDKIKKLKEMGMSSFTPGQLLGDIPVIGSAAQKFEQYATSMPLTGSMISTGIETSIKDFNRALANKVLEPLGVKVPKDVKAGNDLIQHVNETLQNSYDTVLNNASFRNALDPRTGTTTVENIWNRMTKASNNLVPVERNMLEKDVVDNIVKHIENNTVLNGNQFRAAEKYLGNKANSYFEKGSDDLGRAYQRVQDALRKELEKQNPQVSSLLSKTHDAFKRFLPVEKAAAMRGANEGVFTPQQFKSAAESSAGRKATASGQGVMIPESQAGVQGLGKTMPSSGTTERALTAKGLMGGAGELVTTMGIPATIAGLVYNPISQKLLSNLATGARPEVIQKLAPAMTKSAAQVGSQMVQPERRAPLSPDLSNPMALP